MSEALLTLSGVHTHIGPYHILHGVDLVVPSGAFAAVLGGTLTLIGTTLVETQEAQQAGGLVFLPMFIPIYLIVPIVENPDGPLADQLRMSIAWITRPYSTVLSARTVARRSLFSVLADLANWIKASSSVTSLESTNVLSSAVSSTLKII